VGWERVWTLSDCSKRVLGEPCCKSGGLDALDASPFGACESMGCLSIHNRAARMEQAGGQASRGDLTINGSGLFDFHRPGHIAHGWLLTGLPV